MTGGPRRLRDDPNFMSETGVDLGAEAEALATHDLPRLKARVMGAVARGQAPRLSAGRGGLGLGHWVTMIAVGGAIAGALASGGAATERGAKSEVAPVSSAHRATRKAVASLQQTADRPVSPAVAERAVTPAAPDDPIAPIAPIAPIWTEVARAVPAPPTRPPRRVTRRPDAPPRMARLEVSPALVKRLELPPIPALTLPESDPTPLDKDLLEALAESLRRKTFK